jgi:ubiquinone/menaquinone biosynthesis C-methylase UbiE
MDFNEAKKIMEINKKFYDLLAEDFARTHASAMEEFASLAGYWQEGDKVLDLGCGNGRFYDLVCQPGKDIKYFGVDNSAQLIALAKQQYPLGQFILGDGLSLPFGDNFFDKVLCVAVLHHLPGYDMRREFLRQAWRVMKKSGQLILVVSPRERNWQLLLKYLWLKIIGKSRLDWGDFYEPWGEQGVRYFHVFSKKELRVLLEDSGWQVESLGVLTRQNGKRNIVVVAKK